MQHRHQFHKENQKDFGFDAVENCQTKDEYAQFQTFESFNCFEHCSIAVENQIIEKIYLDFLL
jgi:hypothetical protein